MRFAAPTEKYPERRTDRDINLCQWWTPTWLVEAMVKLSGIPKGAYVLEPAAGSGAIVRALKTAGTSAMHDAGLLTPDAPVSDAEAGWVVRRLAELLDEVI